MSDFYDDGEPADIELNIIAKETAKLDDFRAAAQEITKQIQSKTSHGLCNDLTEIRVRRALFFSVAVPEHVRQKVIRDAQAAVNKVIKTAADKYMNDLSSIAKFGLCDMEEEPHYEPGTALAVYKSITPQFAADVARSGTAVVLNEALNDKIDAVYEDDDEEMPISYEGRSGTEQRALYVAFIHAAHKAMQICNDAAQPSDERIFKHLEKLNVATP